MKSTLRFTQITAGFFSLAFIFLSALVLILVTAEGYFFQAEPYQGAYKELNLSSQFPIILADEVSSRMKGDQQTREDNQLRSLTQDDYTILFSTLFSKNWIDSNALGLIDQMTAYAENDATELSLVIDTREIKSQLSGDTGKALVVWLVQKWPDCTEAQTAQITQMGISGNLTGFPACKPADGYLSGDKPLYEYSLAPFAETIPDQVDLVDFLPAHPLVSKLEKAENLSALRWAMRLSPFASLALLFLITVFVVRSKQDLLIWWGSNFIGVGLTGLVIAGAGETSLIAAFVQTYLNNHDLAAGEALSACLINLVTYLSQRFFLWVGIGAEVVFILGIALCAGWLFSLKKK